MSLPRLLLMLLFAGLLPAALVRSGVALRIGQEESLRVEEALATMRRATATLAEEISRETPRAALVGEVVRELSALPALDPDAVGRVRERFERRHPGLLRMAVFAGTTSAELFRARTPVAFAPAGPGLGGSSTVSLAFAGFLYHYWLDGEKAETPRWKSMGALVSSQLLGGRTDARTVAASRSEPVAVARDGRPAHLAWDLIGRPVPGGIDRRFEAMRGLAILVIDDAAYRGQFTDEALLARKRGETGGAFEIGFAHPESGALPAALFALDPATRRDLAAGFARAPVTGDGPLLAAFAPLPGADGRIVYAALPRDAVWPLRRRIERSVDAALALFLLLACALAAAVARGRFNPYLPVRLQATAFLLAASLPALCALYYFGIEELRGGRALATGELAERLGAEIAALDAALSAHEGKLLRRGLSLRDRLAAGEPLGSVEAELHAMRHEEDILENYLIFSASGETALMGDRKGNEAIILALRMVALAALDEFNAAGGGARRERPSLTKTIVDKLSRSSGFTEKIMMHRGRLHRLNLVGQEVTLLLEPIGPAGNAHAVAAFVFDLKSVRKGFVREYVGRTHRGDGIRLFAAHALQRYRRYPEGAEDAEVAGFLDRVIEARAPLAETLVTGGRRVLAAGRPLREAPDYAVAALVDRAEVERKVDRRVRLFRVALLATLLCALSAGLLFARRIVAPVRVLERGVAAVAAGDYAARVSHGSRDEFGTLAASFNDMARGLEERERMSRYVSDFVRIGVKSGDGRPAARAAKCSILFCDIRDFTTLTETHPPQAIVAMLNGYFDRMTRVIKECGGVVDKFIGDAVMAVFPSADGAPDELRAVCAALSMRREVALLNAERRAEGLFEVENGIGISTGEVIMGDIGSAERLDHTVIGDHVNLAARLEALSKEGKYSRIILAGDTRDAVDPFLRTVPLGERTVKGKTRAVEVVEVAGPREPAALAPLLDSADPDLRALGGRLASFAA